MPAKENDEGKKSVSEFYAMTAEDPYKILDLSLIHI